MTSKEYLGQIRRLDFRIKQKRRELEELRDLQGRTMGVDYSGAKVQSSFHGYEGEKIAIEIMELEKDITDELVVLQKRKALLFEEINRLENEIYVEILAYRYINCMRLEEIAVEMHMSFDWVRHLHGKALQEFQKFIDARKG